MKQIVQDVRSGDTVVLDVPIPKPGLGMALVRTGASLVSVGTERTLVEFAAKSLAGKARSRPDLVKQVLDKDYTKEDYIKQFTIRVPENLAKIERVEKYHRENIPGSPQEVYETLKTTRQQLNKARELHGDYISPFDLAG